MPDPSLGRLRLVAQGLVTRPYARPVDAVAASVAMQGQDLPGVLASAALRTTSGRVADVVADLDAGRLVRGYPMRGTVFLQSADDVTWTTELCAAPSLRAAAARRRQLELTDADLDRAREVSLAFLADGPRSRADLFARWEAAGLSPTGGRGYHALFVLLGEVTLVYGPWNGTDQDVAIARDWLPTGGTLEARFNSDRVAATAEMLRRYLTSHGPATIRDFAWWTKLGLKEIRSALPLVEADLESDAASGAASDAANSSGEPRYWRPGLLDEAAALGRTTAAPLLLPGFDEWVLGYADRLFAMTDDEHAALVPGNNGVFKKSVVRNGRVVGTWTRSGRAGQRRLELTEFAPHSPRQRATLERLFAGYPWVSA